MIIWGAGVAADHLKDGLRGAGWDEDPAWARTMLLDTGAGMAGSTFPARVALVARQAKWRASLALPRKTQWLGRAERGLLVDDPAVHAVLGAGCAQVRVAATILDATGAPARPAASTQLTPQASVVCA